MNGKSRFFIEMKKFLWKSKEDEEERYESGYYSSRQG